MPTLLRLYAQAGRVAEGAAAGLLRARLKRGKEDGARLGERRGEASLPRPDGRLLHVHAASVGETNSILPLIRAIAESQDDVSILLTTGTVSSARLVAGKLPLRTIHQFAPLDIPAFADRFAAHWKPDLSLFVESELWPNLVLALKRQGARCGIVNARMSARSTKRWKLAGSAATWLLGKFDFILAQDESDAGRLLALGASQAVNAGNLKYDVPPPSADPGKLADLRGGLADRPLCLAASTHAGEELIVAEAHRRAATDVADLLTIIVPRHAERGPEIAEDLRGRGFAIALRSRGERIDDADIYIADTMGELGLFYRIVPMAFMGGSLIRHGGQNPIEPVKLDCAVLHGPHVHNFASMYAKLDDYGGAGIVRSSGDLAAATVSMTQDRSRASEMAARAQLALHDEAGALERTLKVLRPYLQVQSP